MSLELFALTFVDTRREEVKARAKNPESNPFFIFIVVYTSKRVMYVATVIVPFLMILWEIMLNFLIFSLRELTRDVCME